MSAAQGRLALLPALALFGAASPAYAIWEDDEGALSIDGSFRNTTAVVDYYDSPLFGANEADGLSYSSLRLTANGDPADWFSYELHAVQDAMLLTSPGASGAFEFGASQTTRYRLVSGSWDWAQDQEGDVDARLYVDRAYVRYRLSAFDLTLGRQAVTFGKARFWNPLDVFLPFDSRQFDLEYKRGVDAVRVDVPLDEMSGLNLVGTPGRVDEGNVYDRSWYGSAVMGRAYTNVADWDLAAQGGKIYGGYQLGGGLTGVLGPIEVRAEGAYFFALKEKWEEQNEPVRVPSHLTAAAGVGRLFESSLNLQAEYLYNGAGNDDDLTEALQRVMQGRALQMSEHLAAALVSYELLPILTGSVATIFSFSDHSGILQPGLMYSVSDESDVHLGALIAYGKRPRPVFPDPGLRSEFGTYPNFYYVQYRFYF